MSVTVFHVQSQVSISRIDLVKYYELTQLVLSGYFSLIPHSLFMIMIYFLYSSFHFHLEYGEIRPQS